MLTCRTRYTDGDFCSKLHYLSGDVASALFPHHLTTGARRGGSIALRLCLEGAFLFFRRPCLSLPLLKTRIRTGAHQCSQWCPQPCVATYFRCFFTPVTTLSLPVCRLTSLRVSAGAAPFHFVLGEDLCSLGDHLRVLSLATGLYSRHQRAHVLRDGIADTW